MLVLKRKVGQNIVIAGDIRITILKIQGSQVEIGIEAPAHIPILRGELESSQKQQALALLAREPMAFHRQG